MRLLRICFFTLTLLVFVNTLPTQAANGKAAKAGKKKGGKTTNSVTSTSPHANGSPETSSYGEAVASDMSFPQEDQQTFYNQQTDQMQDLTSLQAEQLNSEMSTMPDMLTTDITPYYIESRQDPNSNIPTHFDQQQRFKRQEEFEGENEEGAEPPEEMEPPPEEGEPPEVNEPPEESEPPPEESEPPEEPPPESLADESVPAVNPPEPAPEMAEPSPEMTEMPMTDPPASEMTDMSEQSTTAAYYTTPFTKSYYSPKTTNGGKKHKNKKLRIGWNRQSILSSGD